MSYHIGDYKTESKDYRGWFVGSFADKGPRYTEDVEVKYWEFEPGPNNHPMKKSVTTEVTLLLSGRTEAVINGEKFTFEAGQYAIIHPGTPNNLVENVLEKSIGITIKAPSDINSKIVIKEDE